MSDGRDAMPVGGCANLAARWPQERPVAPRLDAIPLPPAGFSGSAGMALVPAVHEGAGGC